MSSSLSGDPLGGGEYFSSFQTMDDLEDSWNPQPVPQYLPSEIDNNSVSTSVKEINAELLFSFQSVSKCINIVVNNQHVFNTVNPTPLILARNYIDMFRQELYNTIKPFSYPLVHDDNVINNDMVHYQVNNDMLIHDDNKDKMDFSNTKNNQKSIDAKPPPKGKTWEFHTEMNGGINGKKKRRKRKGFETEFITQMMTKSPSSMSEDENNKVNSPLTENSDITNNSGSIKVFKVLSPQTVKRIQQNIPQIKDAIGINAPRTPSRLSDFELLDAISVGAYGTTRLCYCRDNKCYYALKILHRSTIYKNQQMEHIINEKQILSNIKHSGIIKLFTTFTNERSLFLLLEFVPGGELFMYIRKYGRLEPAIVKFYIAEIIIVLEYLHSLKIAYRDIKPENILLDEKGHIKLSEFGFSKHIPDRTWTMCGTPDYIAPEIISGAGHGTAVDWWSLGVLIFEMLAGHPPFVATNTLELFNHIREPENIQYPKHLDTQVVNLIKRLLVVNPAFRLGATHAGVEELKTHPWFQTEPKIDWAVVAKWEGEGPIKPNARAPVENFSGVGEIKDMGEANITIPQEIQAFFDLF